MECGEVAPNAFSMESSGAANILGRCLKHVKEKKPSCGLYSRVVYRVMCVCVLTDTCG